MPSLIRGILIVALCVAQTGFAIPGTDISLFRILTSEQGLVLQFDRRVTSRPGYDNQPSFSLDSNQLYFTRIQDGNADIWVYQLADHQEHAITQSPVNLYSPTERPSGHLSVVTEENGLQTLSLVNKGKVEKSLSGDIKPIGYHAWLNQHEALVFRLAEPHELLLLDTKKQSAELIEKDIGRCLVSANNEKHVFFSRRINGKLWLSRFNRNDKKIEKLLLLKKDNEDFAYHPEHGVIHSDGERFFVAEHPFNNWMPVLVELKSESHSFALKGVTRLAFSPDGNFLAVVHTE